LRTDRGKWKGKEELDFQHGKDGLTSTVDRKKIQDGNAGWVVEGWGGVAEAEIHG